MLGQERAGVLQGTLVRRHRQELGRRVVGKVDAFPGIRDQDSRLQVTDHEGIDLLKIGHVGAALGGDFLAAFRAPGQDHGQDGDAEIGGPEHPGVGVVGQLEESHPVGIEFLAEYRHAGQGSEQQSATPTDQDSPGGHRQAQQNPHAARDSTGGVHDEGDQGNVHQYLGLGLHAEGRPVQNHRYRHDEDGDQVDRYRRGVKGRRELAQGGGQSTQEEQNAQHAAYRQAVKKKHGQGLPGMFLVDEITPGKRAGGDLVAGFHVFMTGS